jgi:PAS domain S-box-containing protein
VSVESTFEEMKRYVRFGDEDARLLALFKPLGLPHFRRIAEEFYDRIREHQGAHNVFTGEEQIQRLQRSLVRWMERVCSGPYDDAYFRETAHIGRVHVRIGLPQRYMFTAMALIRVSLVRIAEDNLGDAAVATREAISRALDLELAIMVGSYADDYIARIQNVERLEKKEADTSLRRTRHRYVNAVELARVMIVGLDAGGAIRLFNREAERVTGFPRDEVLGQPFDAVLPGSASHEEHGPLIARAAAGESVAAEMIEGLLRTRAGKLRDVRWQIAYAPAKDDPDEVVLFVIGRDVTDEKALAARLRQNEKLAAIGTLAAGLAHEIRNPLNGAHLHVTFLERRLRKKEHDAEALEAVRVVSDEIKRLSALVSEFLNFARPKPLDLQPVSLRGLCDRVIHLMRPVALAAKVTLSCELPATELIIDLDPAKMEQVLLNVIQNAIEALEPQGGGRVTLRARRKPTSAVIEVEDDGPGLSGQDAPIFDPFFSTKPSGTGLGLAIAHRIVTDHEGSIDVESKPGRTIFSLTLPLRSPLAQPAP